MPSPPQMFTPPVVESLLREAGLVISGLDLAGLARALSSVVTREYTCLAIKQTGPKKGQACGSNVTSADGMLCAGGPRCGEHLKKAAAEPKPPTPAKVVPAPAPAPAPVSAPAPVTAPAPGPAKKKKAPAPAPVPAKGISKDGDSEMATEPSTTKRKAEEMEAETGTETVPVPCAAPAPKKGKTAPAAKAKGVKAGPAPPPSLSSSSSSSSHAFPPAVTKVLEQPVSAPAVRLRKMKDPRHPGTDTSIWVHQETGYIVDRASEMVVGKFHPERENEIIDSSSFTEEEIGLIRDSWFLTVRVGTTVEPAHK